MVSSQTNICYTIILLQAKHKKNIIGFKQLTLCSQCVLQTALFLNESCTYDLPQELLKYFYECSSYDTPPLKTM